MFRVAAGETISRTITVAGSGALSTQTFVATVLDQAGRGMSASAAITDASAREVTITVASSEWLRGEGGSGRLQLMMNDGSVTTEVAREEIRIMPGYGVWRRGLGYV